MHRHVKTRFPGLNHKRIHETVARDTAFSTRKDISGATCCQVFYGKESHHIDVYGLRTKRDGPDAYDDFLRHQGVPQAFRSDNAKMHNISAKLKAKFCDHLIGVETTEPHHPQQNPC
jgi:hypothetical protein